MTKIGYTMMSEQAGPEQLVRDVTLAEEAGFDFAVESAKIWDLPDSPPPIGVAVSGPESCRLAGRHADAMIAVEPRTEIGDMFDAAGGDGKPRVGQIALSYDPDEQLARSE
jgi:alkanesulfonate monooxygenase SsuD/methylene tetrahydromethanopterin reductase-like flavin-dependent oxidoreductase (luciferase family)